MKVRIEQESNYKAFFFPQTGRTVRIALDSSKPIEKVKFPEFYDVKITDYCTGECPYCYMDSTDKKPHFDNICEKIEQYFGAMEPNQRPFQVAIGGGEPTTHPEFLDLLATFQSLGIQPNYTTNGRLVCKDIINATIEYCGGVAVSCHPHLNAEWRMAVQSFASRGMKLNLHLIISDKDSIEYFLECYKIFKDVVDHFVLLPYGSQGRAKEKRIDWEYLLGRAPMDCSKLAFGANFHQYLVKGEHPFKVSLYEPEAFSGFLDLSDMKLYESSFDLRERQC